MSLIDYISDSVSSKYSQLMRESSKLSKERSNQQKEEADRLLESQSDFKALGSINPSGYNARKTNEEWAILEPKLKAMKLLASQYGPDPALGGKNFSMSSMITPSKSTMERESMASKLWEEFHKISPFIKDDPRVTPTQGFGFSGVKARFGMSDLSSPSAIEGQAAAGNKRKEYSGNGSLVEQLLKDTVSHTRSFSGYKKPERHLNPDISRSDRNTIVNDVSRDLPVIMSGGGQRINESGESFLNKRRSPIGLSGLSNNRSSVFQNEEEEY